MKIPTIESITIGSIVGWLFSTFMPIYPLIIIAVAFILYDVWSAYELDKRVKKKYPKRKKTSKFTSDKLRHVITTLKERIILIVAAFTLDKWVLFTFDSKLVYMMTGIICVEQFISIAENKSSCRDHDKDSRIWKFLSRVLADKTSRHFDIDEDMTEIFKNEKNNDI